MGGGHPSRVQGAASALASSHADISSNIRANADSIAHNAGDISSTADKLDAALYDSPLAHHLNGTHLCEFGVIDVAAHTCTCGTGYVGGGAWQEGSALYPACTAAACAVGTSGTAPNCGACRFCLDMRMYGGAGTLRQPCLQQARERFAHSVRRAHALGEANLL